MKANCWHGKRDIRVDTVPDPKILNPRDAIIKVTSTAICGSDLHLYNSYVPSMLRGDIMGHEFMGEVMEVGPAVKNLKVGDRVVVPFPIACGACRTCQEGNFSLCENSNPNAYMAEKLWGYSTAGMFGYSHLTGGYAGGQAEYVRVPFADVGPIKVPAHLTDDQVLFLSDIFPTGYMAADMCNLRPEDTVAVWGAGPVGLMAMKSAKLLGAGRVIAIDRFADRLAMAEQHCGAETINYETTSVLESLRAMTSGIGPDACIDAVGMEAHGCGMIGFYDKAKQSMMLQQDRPTALREAMMACKNGGTVSVAGVYGGFIDKFPFGSVMNRSLTIRTGQTHVQRYQHRLLDRIENGDIDPSFVITHHMALADAPKAFDMFMRKHDHAVKIVLKP